MLVTKKQTSSFLPISDAFWVILFHRDVREGDNGRIEKAQLIVLWMADQRSYLGICVDRRRKTSRDAIQYWLLRSYKIQSFAVQRSVEVSRNPYSHYRNPY